MSNLLCHERLSIRFAALLGLGLVLFLLAWTLGYLLLPEGVLRGRTGAGTLAGEEAAGSFLAEFLRILALNLVPMVMIVAANRVLKVGCYPLGYVIPLFYLILYGITLGTNSFSIPMPERMAPSPAVLGRSGLYEMAAYMLAAAATYHIPAYRARRLIPPDSEKIVPEPSFRRAVDWGGAAAALALLLAANAWEAYQIISLA